MMSRARAGLFSFRTFLIFTFLLLLGTSSEKKTRIFLIGDSTMADKPLADNPEHGWGQMFPMFFPRHVEIYNAARNGRSTKSYIDEGLWKKVYDQLQPGDYVFIQFGHNDARREDSTRYSAPRPDFKNNLLRFVSEARKKQAFPILMTPITRRDFNKAGGFVGTHGEYSDIVREVAREERAPLIDMFEKSKQVVQRLGDEHSKDLFLAGVPARAFRHWDKKRDNTHFTRTGAIQFADMVVDGLKELHLPLEHEIVRSPSTNLVGTGKVVGLDYYFNNEWRLTKDSTLERWHYTWEDTTNSGWSELGKNIDRLGADLDTLQSAPTDSSLAYMSIFIIVDPDTPKETKDPHYINNDNIATLERWVKNGGVLMLMANDKGNCEFEHLNALASHFGIHFNEDHCYMVVNNNYTMGHMSKFPNHPMFKNVHQIFLKEISSLNIREPAKPILQDDSIVIMASAKVGKGLVFAIGDPWLYNEYFDNRKLPEGYENYDAGVQVFRWLLSEAQAVH